jgi:uncharacterized protein YndB with AHSA1/START domain
MPATPRKTSVEHEFTVAARPETVFAYFTDPVRMVEWMGAEATLDPRPGGICRIGFQPTQPAADLLDAAFAGEHGGATRPAEPYSARVMLGQFVEVDPYRRISFTWGWEGELYAMPPQSTAVEVSFRPDGESTVVRLVHRRVPAAATPIHRAGWEHYLPRLAVAAAGGNPGSDPWQVAARTARP